MAPWLLILFLNYDIRIKSETSKLFRNLSTGIYFLHRLVMKAVELCERKFDFYFSYIAFSFIVVIISIVICKITYRSKCQFINSLLK